MFKLDKLKSVFSLFRQIKMSGFKVELALYSELSLVLIYRFITAPTVALRRQYLKLASWCVQCPPFPPVSLLLLFCCFRCFRAALFGFTVCFSLNHVKKKTFPGEGA